MAFALQNQITPQARFSRVANIAAILEQGTPQPMPAPLGKGDALARIRAQLNAQRN